MKLTDFDYHLPEELIAQTPAEPRDSARLLHFKRSSEVLEDKVFSNITDMLWENDVLVVNETRVIKARLKGFILDNPSLLRREKTAASSLLNEERIEWGRPCEIFLHTQISENSWDCLVYPGKKLKPGTKVSFPTSPNLSLVRRGENTILPLNKGELEGVVIGNSKKWRIVEFSLWGEDFLQAIDAIWETPLPPYIKDSDSPDERYQTVYNDSQKSRSVAAPTAGLHFTPELMEKLEKKWVKIEKVCLHVWLGTFMNVEVENIEDHDMHSEQIYISPHVSQRLNTYKSEGKRIIAVGTTSVRTLESFTGDTWILWSGTKDTNIFIYPGYKWKFVEWLITNFHLPKSTLLMLVSSFIWDENRKRVYQHAVDSQYRFFSFWDAMFLE